MKNFLAYLLARAQERSTVAGVAAAGVAAFGLHSSPDSVTQIVNLVVVGAGLAASLIPGGK